MSRRVLVVIPAYNEAERLPRLLADIDGYLRSDVPARASVAIDFLVVDDGSRPAEFEAMRTAIEQVRQDERVSLLRLDQNRGKGAAIRTGFEHGLEQAYEYLGFIDADGSIGIGELHRAVVYLTDHSPALSGVIGSRLQILGRRVDRKALRHYTGRAFATFVSLYFSKRVYDTQCGLKVFTRDAVRRHLQTPVDHRWVWDTQLLLAMLHAGEVVHELPIDWAETPRSKVSLLRDPLRMIWRLIWFRRRLRAIAQASSGYERV